MNLPVYKRQWDTISSLKQVIVEKSTKAFQHENSKVVFSAMSAILILDNCTITDIFHLYLTNTKTIILSLLSTSIDNIHESLAIFFLFF